MAWNSECYACKLMDRRGSEYPKNIISVCAGLPHTGVKSVLFILPGLDSRRYSVRYSAAMEAAVSSGFIVAEHVLPGSESRSNEEFKSYGECVREIKDAYDMLVSGSAESGTGGCMAGEVTVMADGLAARLVIEAIEEFGLGFKRLILIDPLLDDGCSQYPDLCGKMNINGRVAERCGRVPVETGKSECPFVTEEFFHGLETSAPMKEFGNIAIPMVVVSHDKGEAEKLAEKGRDVSIVVGASYEPGIKLTADEMQRDAGRIATAVMEFATGMQLGKQTMPNALDENGRLSAVIADHLPPSNGDRGIERIIP